MKEFTSENFEQEVLKSELPVLVDFNADWCGPCKMMRPILEQLTQEYDGELVIGGVNVDDAPDIAQQFQVMSIPMFAFIKDGKMVESAVGAIPKEKLKSMIDKVLA